MEQCVNTTVTPKDQMNGMDWKRILIRKRDRYLDLLCSSTTDTEVIAKLIAYLYAKDRSVTFREVVGEAVSLLQGAFAIVVKSRYYPNECVAYRMGSPLILGIKGTNQLAGELQVQLLSQGSVNLSPREGGHGVEYFIASDPSAIAEHTKNVVFLEHNDLLHFRNGQVQVFTADENAPLARKMETLEVELNELSKGGFAHFMLKEIVEQEQTVIHTMRGRVDFENYRITLGGLMSHMNDIMISRRLVFIGCGTSFHSAVAARSLVEELASVPVQLELASDFLDRSPRIYRSDTCVFLSQSGETADTLRALEYCKQRNALCVGITNTVGSAIARLTDCGIHLNCGVEIGVASTKAYTSQIVALTLFALKMGEDSLASEPRRKSIIDALHQLPRLIHQALTLEEQVKAIAQRIHHSKSLLIMGRGFQYATCLEAALKVKELTYMHSEAVLSGELKHGPLALIDEHLPIIFVATKDRLYDKVKNGFQQVAARNGKPIIICSEGDTSIPAEFPQLAVPATVDCIQTIVNIIPFQLLAYHIAVNRGVNVDQPRNLAKSVTVE